jgi:outer membrane protein TolC
MRLLSRRTIPLLFCFLLTGPAALTAQNGGPMPLTLSQAINLALKQNRDIRLAHLAVTDSVHKKEIARAAYFPKITTDAKVLHITQLQGVEIPAGAFGNYSGTGLIPSTTLFIDQGAATSYVSGTGLVQPFTQMFKIHAMNRAAAADVHTAEVQVTQAEEDIALKVRQLYYSILIAQLRQQAATGEMAASQVKVAEAAEDVLRGNALDVVSSQNRAAALSAKQDDLVERLQVRDLTISLNDLLGLPLNTVLSLDGDAGAVDAALPSREECVRLAQERNPQVQAAMLTVEKAKAGLTGAKDAYIPDITGLARYSYQSGIPFLVHNFGTFGFSLSYDLFDGGRREAEVKDARTQVSEAVLTLEKAKEEVAVEVETAYDKVEQLKDLAGVAKEVLEARVEASRVTDRRFEQNAALASVRAEARAQAISAKASVLAANLGLSLAEADVKRMMGEVVR